MKLVSTGEFELGFFAFGGRPVGVIAIGVNPIGVISIGFAPVGVVAIGCGAAFGVVSICCGVAGGIWTRVCGVGLGAESSGVGLAVSLAGPGGPFYWPRFALVVAAVGGGLFAIGQEGWGRILMNRVVDTTWSATVRKSEGLYLEEGSPCLVSARLRSDGVDRVVVDARVECGSLTLVERDRLWDCTVTQHVEDGGQRYGLSCMADRQVISDDDGPDEEIAGMSIETRSEPETVRVWASGPPPMATELDVAAWSALFEGESLIPE